jgi:DNA replication protein DnaC
MTDENEIPKWKREHAAELAKAKRLQLERMKLPREALESPTDKTLAMDAVSSPFTLLILSGSPGTGKTVAAVSWIVDYVNADENWPGPGSALELRGMPVFTTAAGLSRWDRYEQATMSKLLYSPRLVIDDLGVEYLDKNGFLTALIDEVVNERYSGRRPLIMTTNLDVEGFRERYGNRVADRIRQSGRFVGCGNASMRKPAATPLRHWSEGRDE